MIRSTPTRAAALLLTVLVATATAPDAGAVSRCGRLRPSIVEAGPVVQAFARIGWEWGGDWNQSKDYQHFSHIGL